MLNTCLVIILKSFTNDVELNKLLFIAANMTFKNEIGHIFERSKAQAAI